MSDNDKFNECLDCPGCSGDCGQGCGSCPENKANEVENSPADAINTSELSQKSFQQEDAPQQTKTQSGCKEVEINPMDLDEVAEKTEDLRPKIDPSRGKLDCFNYLADIPGGKADYDIVEVQFKNTRKGFYRNTANLDLKLGDMVAVESQPGHDIGRVTLVGHLVRNQMRKAGLSEDSEIRKIFRFARPADMEKYYEAKALEIPTMIGSRQIAAELGLKMKIGDVEYQGDGLKAIFYYIADERVDFRQLIKILAERFKIRVEMRQIGARQEAGRIGGIGPCGRPLCCSTWMTNFVTVATSAARHQDLSLNPQKLAGQCAKLKCCLNFEIDTYLESVKKMPPKETRLETLEASWYHFKTDIFKGEITYSSDKKNAVNTVTITAERAFEIIEMNSRGEKPLSLIPDEEAKSKAQGSYNDILGDDSQIGRFDKKKKKKKKKKDKEAAAAASAAAAGDDVSENLAEDASEEDTPQTNTPAPSKAKEQPKKSKNKDNVPAKAQNEATQPAPTESVEPNTEKPQQSSPSDTEVADEAVKENEAAKENEVAKDKEKEVSKEEVTQAPQTQPNPQSSEESLSDKKSQVTEKTKASDQNAQNEASVAQKPQTEQKPQAESESESKPESSSDTVAEPQAKADQQKAEGPISNVVDEHSEYDSVEKPRETTEILENFSSKELTSEAPAESNSDNTSEQVSSEETQSEPKHHNHPSHHAHHHHNHEHSAQEVNAEDAGETAEGRETLRKGNNPNKGQWQGKNPGKSFKPQQGKGPDQQKNREPGKVFRAQSQGKGQDQSQNGPAQHQGQGQHGHPHHQNGQQPQGQQGQQGQGKEPFKPKGQNPHQDRRNNNPGKVFKPQHQGEGGQRGEHQGPQRPNNPRDGQPSHGQNQNGPREDFQGQGGNNKKKKKKPYPQENPSNPNQPSHGEGRSFNQGHHNPNRPNQGPRPNQNNPRPSGQNPAGGNVE